MKKIVALCLILFGFTAMQAQNTKPVTADNDKVLQKAEVMPKFSGDINKYFTDHVTYPADAKANKVQGTVYFSFVVEKDGSVSHVQVVKGLQGGITLEKEGMRVISEMPKWTPGKQDGQAVRVQYTVPIRFTLDGTDAPKAK